MMIGKTVKRLSSVSLVVSDTHLHLGEFSHIKKTPPITRQYYILLLEKHVHSTQNR